MNIRSILLLLGFCIWSVTCGAEVRYRLWLTTKSGTPYSIERPEAYLSEKAIDRRNKQGIAVDSSDLPVNPLFVKAVRRLGAKPVVCSRWLNTLVVTVPDSTWCDTLSALPFVRKTEFVWEGKLVSNSVSYRDKGEQYERKRKNPYGAGLDQLRLHRADRLHGAGFTGKGMIVAILDGGFCQADQNPAIDSNAIIGTRDFVCPGSDFYQGHNHGSMVLSVMAARKKGVYIGSAPDARFWLIRTEDTNSEFPIEEDFWAAGIEFADSAGADVVTSSLGYMTFDRPALNYLLGELDGRTALITRAAEKGTQKGLIVLNSAGNEGESRWGKIIFPADAPGILTVGAVDVSRKPAAFTGWGYTADNRIKPDIAAVGFETKMIAADGLLSSANGTSFSTPLMAGMVACLWQALPHLKANELTELVRRSASQYRSPDRQSGYGLPDVYKIYREQKK